MVGGGVPRWSLSLEDYVDFFLNPQQHYLNKNHLNQVMSMHGFQKLNIPRTDLVEESKTFTMESPFRSTLKEKITSSSLLNPDEIIKDLATLRWNEWSIGSTRSEFAEAGKPSSFKKAADLYKKKNKKGLTDISNLPAGPNLNSRQNQAQKKNQGILEMGNLVSKKGKTSVGRKRIYNQVNKLNDPETIRKRSKLMLPVPQITDYELEEIDCFASDLLAGSEAQGSGATPALLAGYSQTTREEMPHFRNPRKTPSEKADGIMMEAENHARLGESETPLLGGDNLDLHPSEFSGVTPERKDIQIANQLATPLSTPGASGVTVTPIIYMTPSSGDAFLSGMTPRGTPFRDKLHFNEDMDMMPERSLKHELRREAELIRDDNAKYPLDEKVEKERKKWEQHASNGKPAFVPEIEDCEEEEMKEADLLTREEIQLLRVAMKQMDTAATELEHFQALQKEERLAASNMINGFVEEIKKLKELEQYLQHQYGNLIAKQDKIERLFQEYRSQAKLQEEIKVHEPDLLSATYQIGSTPQNQDSAQSGSKEITFHGEQSSTANMNVNTPVAAVKEDKEAQLQGSNFEAPTAENADLFSKATGIDEMKVDSSTDSMAVGLDGNAKISKVEMNGLGCDIMSEIPKENEQVAGTISDQDSKADGISYNGDDDITQHAADDLSKDTVSADENLLQKPTEMVDPLLIFSHELQRMWMVGLDDFSLLTE